MSTTSENKYNYFVFTWNANSESGLVDEIILVEYLRQHTLMFVFQKEMGEETSRTHYQGCFKTKIRKRQSTLLKEFSEFFDASYTKYLTINRMCGNWDESFAYCTKDDTRVGEIYMSSQLEEYKGKDIAFFQNFRDWYGWQTSLLFELFNESPTNLKIADDRSIMWITDKQGNCGKSKFSKFLCVTNSDIIKVPFGSASQLRSSLIAAGRRKMYIIDIPRTMGDDDSLNNILTAIEDLKNGYVISSMYGKYETLMMDPPHIIIFSNRHCPVEKMSEDRWDVREINPVTKHLRHVDKGNYHPALGSTGAFYDDEENYDLV